MNTLRFAIRILAIASLGAAVLPTSIDAAKPVPPGPAPPGTIYYYELGSAFQVSSMATDGSNKTGLAVSTRGIPSGLLHGGKRWFLYKAVVPGEVGYYHGGATRVELFAEREDGAVRVRLTDDPAFYADNSGYVDRGWHWAPDEVAAAVTISGLARLFYPDGTVVPGSGGIYTATLRFDQAGDVIGLDAPPAFLVSLGTVPLDPWGDPEQPDARVFSWSPDMTEVVADRRDGAYHEVRIVDIATGVSTTLLEDAVEGYELPEWSPNGLRVVFKRYSGQDPADAIESIAPDGTNRSILAPGSRNLPPPTHPSWSPDSAFVLYNQWPNRGNADVWRMTATGAGKTNLTSDSSGNCHPLGWR
jgi:hypothetical protein